MTRLAMAMLMALASGHQAASQQSGRPTAALQDSRRIVVLAAEENRAATAGELRALVDATRSDRRDLQTAAVRALGRLERRDVVSYILPLVRASDANVREEAVNALAQSFKGEPLQDSSSTGQVRVALDTLLSAPRSPAVHRSLGRLPYETVDQVRAAEAVLRSSLEGALRSAPPASTLAAAAARGTESLARLHRRLSPPGEETIEVLRRIAGRHGGSTLGPEARRNAMAALVAAQGADAVTLQSALQDQDFEVRRLATLVLAGAGATLTPEERLDLLQTALQDGSASVRVEALRAWARRAAPEHGCSPLVAALSDPSLHVVLVALDALGDQCKDSELVTTLLTAESRTPPTVGRWQREAHAFVALAKRSPDRARIAMPSFARHDDWQVRVYAARAAAAMGDVETLLRLAADPDDNVVEAVLPAIRRRLGAESDRVVIDALNRRTRTTGHTAPARPYQVIREAALQLKGAQSTPALLTAVVGALQRATEERCQTSRDARLALIDRLAELGSSAQATVLAPLLKDIDPRVAQAAARVLTQWTGRPVAAEPQVRQPELPTADSLAERVHVKVEMEGGKAFWIAFYDEEAPLARNRFLRLVRNRYYDGTPFHRIVPNFVIQGGSPNANEYCGDCPFMRDEVGLITNTRGTIGVSTRGRDTGDAQIFVNMVDNPRLDHEYTVFGYVCANDMAVVDDIQEGERMRSVTVSARPDCRQPPR